LRSGISTSKLACIGRDGNVVKWVFSQTCVILARLTVNSCRDLATVILFFGQNVMVISFDILQASCEFCNLLSVCKDHLGTLQTHLYQFTIPFKIIKLYSIQSNTTTIQKAFFLFARSFSVSNREVNSYKHYLHFLSILFKTFLKGCTLHKVIIIKALLITTNKLYSTSARFNWISYLFWMCC
jgi:hypothetical protein